MRAGYGKFRVEPARLTIDEKGRRTIAEVVIHVSKPGARGPQIWSADTGKLPMGMSPTGA